MPSAAIARRAVPALLLLPVLAGLAGVIGPALGYFPALGGTDWTLAPLRAALDWPGLARSVQVTLLTGLGATALSVALTITILAAWHGTRPFLWLTRALAPLMALPHAAAAFGLAFVIAPSGWIARALSPWATGWDQPPDLLIVNDPWGLSLIAGLVIKEVPFLLLMALAALGQADAARTGLVARSLGYGRMTGFLKTVLPRLWPQMRLPVWAVLAYSLSVVDVALILGPTRPPTLAVQVLTWMTHPDLSMRFQAAAMALVLLGVTGAAFVLWHMAERAITRAGGIWAADGARGRGLDAPLRHATSAAVLVLLGLLTLGMAGLALWSLTQQWRFPDAWPGAVSLRHWGAQADRLGSILGTTALIAAAATALSLAAALAMLQGEGRRGPSRLLGLIWLPLIVPQIVFVPGLASMALALGLEGTRAAVIGLHLVFVLPYVALALMDPWRAWDARAGLVAASLGAGPARIFWTLRLPMLARAVAIAAAVGFAVSVTQYLPTLLIGAGRITTVTTEAVALSASANRRLIGIWAIAQMALPALAFAAALALPALIFRGRQGMRAT